MGADDAGAPQHRHGQGRQGADVPVLAGGQVQDVADEGLAGGTHQQGTAQIQKDVQVVEDRPGCAPRSCRSRCRGPGSGSSREMPWDTAKSRRSRKKALDFPHEVVVVGLPLHVPGGALHVHQHHRHPVLGGQGGHLRVEAQGADVVDDGRRRPPGPAWATGAL